MDDSKYIDMIITQLYDFEKKELTDKGCIFMIITGLRVSNEVMKKLIEIRLNEAKDSL